jgi:hypothetical protein
MLRLNVAPATKDGLISTLTVMCGVVRLVAGGMFRLSGVGAGVSMKWRRQSTTRKSTTQQSACRHAGMQPVWEVALEFQHVAVGGQCHTCGLGGHGGVCVTLPSAPMAMKRKLCRAQGDAYYLLKLSLILFSFFLNSRDPGTSYTNGDV